MRFVMTGSCAGCFISSLRLLRAGTASSACGRYCVLETVSAVLSSTAFPRSCSVFSSRTGTYKAFRGLSDASYRPLNLDG
jgi:hypothetical protein